MVAERYASPFRVLCSTKDSTRMRNRSPFAEGTKAMLKRFMARVMTRVVTHPSINARAISLLSRHPNLGTRLRGLAAASGLAHFAPGTAGVPTLTLPDGPQSLSPRAQHIYANLLKAIEQNRPSR